MPDPGDPTRDYPRLRAQPPPRTALGWLREHYGVAAAALACLLALTALLCR